MTEQAGRREFTEAELDVLARADDRLPSGERAEPESEDQATLVEREERASNWRGDLVSRGLVSELEADHRREMESPFT